MKESGQEKKSFVDTFFDSCDRICLDLLAKYYEKNEKVPPVLSGGIPVLFLGDTLKKMRNGEGTTDCIRDGENVGICLTNWGQEMRKWIHWPKVGPDFIDNLRDIGTAPAAGLQAADKSKDIFWFVVPAFIQTLPFTVAITTIIWLYLRHKNNRNDGLGYVSNSNLTRATRNLRNG